MAKSKGGRELVPIEISRAMSEEQGEALVNTLKTRFEENMNRHQGVDWEQVAARLEGQVEKLISLHVMEETGGEPDVISHDPATGEYIFCDCSAESPKGRRSICYDGNGQAEREKKGVHPAGNAVDLATAMGIELLTEDQYRALQDLDEFDTKTSSWLKTPQAIRERGGAIFGDRRYDHIFVYHNGAQSFYSARGFRGRLKV